MKGFSFSQVPWAGSWCVRLCGEQHTQEKGSRRVTLSPAASGQAGGVGRVWGAHRGCLTPLIPAPSRTLCRFLADGPVRDGQGQSWAVLKPCGSWSCIPQWQHSGKGWAPREAGTATVGVVFPPFPNGKYPGSTLSYKERSYCEKMLSEEQKQTEYSCLD